jgi:hypothetical protein
MAERNLSVDHVTIWRWVQRYAPELNRRCRSELRKTNASWRCDETYIRVAGKWTYLYRAVDSTGATIDFLLSARRDAAAAKRFFQKALRSPGHPRPRVIKRRREPVVPKGNCGLEAVRRTRSSLSMSARAVLEQRSGTGSPSHQTPGPSESGIPSLSLGVANASGNRGDEHDPQGTSEMVGEGRHRWSCRIHWTALWADERLIVGPAAVRSRCLIQSALQHFQGICLARTPSRPCIIPDPIIKAYGLASDYALAR